MAKFLRASQQAFARGMMIQMTRKPQLQINTPVRFISASKPAFAKDFVGDGLETDPQRGVRINPERFEAIGGTPRSSEYESVLEQDPYGDRHGSGPNDDIWGEWGLDRDAPFISTGKAAAMLFTAFAGLRGLAWLAEKSDAEAKNPAAPREGLWNMHH